MPASIEVTAEEIEIGDRGSWYFDPIARAACRTFGIPLGEVLVSNERIEFPGGGRIILPEIAREFVSRFDKGEPVKPFVFAIGEDES